MKEVVLIPAYEPDERLLALVEQLAREKLDVLVVDDGSSESCQPIFKATEAYAHVLHAAKNGGKGSALKMGMGVLREVYPEATHFITADADGQHTVEDILRVRRELQKGAGFVLTMRQFHRDIPFRSKLGNNLSRFIYTILSGHFFRDNQSGLRGFDVAHIDWLLRVKGEKYDFEMNALYFADKQHLSITTVPIDAIYIDGNSSSHFDPVLDTLRIYRQLFSSAVGSFVSMALIELMILASSIILGHKFLRITVPSAGAIGLAVHLLVDRLFVFRRVRYRDSMRLTVHTIFRFVAYTLCCQLLCYMAPWASLWVSFNFVAVCCVPLEFLVRKAAYISRYQEYPKEP